MTIKASDLVGGGAGQPINSLVEIYHGSDEFTDVGGADFVKTGVFSDTSYPDATTELAEYGYSGTSFALSGGVQAGIAFDGTNLWVQSFDINNANFPEVVEYTTAGVATGNKFSTNSQTGAAVRGIVWDGTHFWVSSDSNDRIYQYTAAGVYTGTNFSVSSQTTVPFGLAWDGTHFWVTGNDKRYKYTAAGLYTGTVVTMPDNTGSLAHDGNFFWFALNTSSRPQTLVGEQEDGTDTNLTAEITSTITGTIAGLTFGADSLWIQTNNPDNVYRFDKVFKNGISTAVTGLHYPLYLTLSDGDAPLNEAKAIAGEGDTYTDTAGRVWLKTGVTASAATYPGAYSFLDDVVYANTSFDISNETTFSTGITFDGSHLWVLDQGADAVFKYTTSGTYTGTSFSVANEETTPRGITWDGTHFWIVGVNTDTVYQYTAAGVYTGTSFSVSSQETSPYDIVWDGTYFWVCGTSNAVYQYTAAGVYTGTSFSTSGEMSQPYGLAWDGDHFFVLGNGGVVYQYTAVGAYAGKSFDLSAEGTGRYGIASSADRFWVPDTNTDDVFEYDKSMAAGDPTPRSANGIPLYVRVA